MADEPLKEMAAELERIIFPRPMTLDDCIAAYSDMCDPKTITAYYNSLDKHLRYVHEAGVKLVVPTNQLATHDASKFSVEEFPQYANYFYGEIDDDNRDSVATGYALAWLRHIHKNEHHWQHWIFSDNYTPENTNIENGVVQMPEEYALEMVADWMGASMAYTGSWDMTSWLVQHIPVIRVHSKTAAYLKAVLSLEGYGPIVDKYDFAN